MNPELFLKLFLLIDVLPLMVFLVITPAYGRLRVLISIVPEIVLAFFMFGLFPDHFFLIYAVFICIITYLRYQQCSTYRHTVNGEDYITRR
jgi:hypothetical protein